LVRPKVNRLCPEKNHRRRARRKEGKSIDPLSTVATVLIMQAPVKVSEWARK